jgi:hypothetical protein
MALRVEVNDDDTVTVSGRIGDPELVAKVKAYAAEHGVSETDAVRHFLVEGAHEMLRQRAPEDGQHR